MLRSLCSSCPGVSPQHYGLGVKEAENKDDTTCDPTCDTCDMTCDKIIQNTRGIDPTHVTEHVNSPTQSMQPAGNSLKSQKPVKRMRS